jgi:hypothetical protein
MRVCPATSPHAFALANTGDDALFAKGHASAELGKPGFRLA